jgi:protein-L-isoaspartate(D-aspartate) O-methyltransferase
VLEVGAGTGFNAALLGHLVAPGGQVYTIDIDQDLVDAATANLAAAGMRNIEVVCADGGQGYAPGAPYDAIMLTVAAWDITPAWFDQLKPGGRIVLPLSLGNGGPQKSVAFQKVALAEGVEEHLTSTSIHDCGFMRLRGAYAGPEHTLPLGPESGLNLSVYEQPPTTAESIYSWLAAGGRDLPVGIEAAVQEVWSGLLFWISVREPTLASISAHGDLAGRGMIPCLFRFSSTPPICISEGLLGPAGLSLLWLGDPTTAPAEHDPLPVYIRTFGPDPGGTLAGRLAGQVQAWGAAGRPGTAGLRVRALRRGVPYTPLHGEVVVRKRWTKLVIDWTAPEAR